MFYYLYKITNKINGKIYIGAHKTQNLDDGYFGSGKLLILAIKKYGIENFEKDILNFFNTEKELFEAEVEIVNKEFVLRNDTYNLMEGGRGGFTYIDNNGLKYSVFRDDKKRSKEYSKKGIKILGEKRKDPVFCIKASKKISISLEKHYQNNPGHFSGQNHTEETKKRIGEANSKHQKGFGNSQYGTMWITNDIDNKKIKKSDIIPEGWKKGRVIKND